MWWWSREERECVWNTSNHRWYCTESLSVGYPANFFVVADLMNKQSKIIIDDICWRAHEFSNSYMLQMSVSKIYFMSLYVYIRLLHIPWNQWKIQCFFCMTKSVPFYPRSVISLNDYEIKVSKVKNVTGGSPSRSTSGSTLRRPSRRCRPFEC